MQELEDRVEQIFAAIEELREVAGDGKSTRQVLDSIFRSVHSLKATAATHGLENVTRIAHQFENLLHALRVGKTNMSKDVLGAFDRTADALFANIQPASPSTPQADDELFALLQTLSDGSPRVGRLEVEVILNAVPAEIWQALSEEDKHRLKQALGEGASLFLLATAFELTNFDQRFQELKTHLMQKGEMISTAPRVHANYPDKIDFRVLFACESEVEDVRTELSQFREVAVSPIFAQLESDRTREQHAPATVISPTSPKTHSIRIDLDDLDRLISTTHQLSRQTNAYLNELGSPKSELLRPQVHSALMGLAADLVALRMVSIDRVLQRALRAGRSVASTAGKDIDFTLLGHDLKIDKSLSDAISDPLIHLVRNAVDHGIEKPEQRSAAGKSPRGSIRIEAYTLQGQTRIRVTDDGRGIDPDFICSAGKRLGVLPEGVHFGLDQSIRLLFRPGFSTASGVTVNSGRGVGLDVVEKAIEEVGGSIRVASETASGSSFELRLPVTFSLLDVVIVRVSNHYYLLDASQMVSAKTSGRVKSGHKTKHESETVLGLDQILGFESADSATIPLRCSFDRSNSDQQRLIELKVNEVVGREQVLVRNLGSRGGRWLGVAGAAEMRDGTVALLLDLPALTALAS